jgi:hypothetical protein
MLNGALYMRLCISCQFFLFSTKIQFVEASVTRKLLETDESTSHLSSPASGALLFSNHHNCHRMNPHLFAIDHHNLWIY